SSSGGRAGGLRRDRSPAVRAMPPPPRTTRRAGKMVVQKSSVTVHQSGPRGRAAANAHRLGGGRGSAADGQAQADGGEGLAQLLGAGVGGPGDRLAQGVEVGEVTD